MKTTTRFAFRVAQLAVAIGGLTLSLQLSTTFAQYSIDWHTIGGGGGTSTGGTYAISGTIGQPDAAGLMSGGTYSVLGGFWSVIAIQTPDAPLLSIETTSGGVRVSWPLPAMGFLLEQTMAVAPNPAVISWSRVPFPYQTNATHISITVPAPTGNKFYRLRKE